MTSARRFLAILLVLAATGCERAPQPEPQPEPPSAWEDEPTLQPSTMTCDVPAPPAGVTTVQVVFTCGEETVGTWRRVEEQGADSLALAVGELLRGPTIDEREAGLSSFFSAETAGMVRSVSLRGGVAYIDFRDFSAIIPNASTSAGSAQLLDEVAGTIFQFDGIEEAELTFDGSCDAFWNWLQRGCQRLTRDEE